MIASFERYTGPWSMLGGLLVMLSVAIMTLTNATDPTHQAQAASSEPPAAPPLDARLAGPASDYEYSDTPLEDALDHLAQSTNLNFAIDWKALADLGLNRDTPVTLSLKNARPVQALDWILRLVGTPSDSRLDWWMDEDLVTVSTHDRSLRQQAKIVRYSLKDLVPEGVDEDAVVQNLVTIIPSFIGRSNDWEANGGVSSVQPLGDAVIVKTTPENHRQLALLLAALAKPDGEPRLLESVDAATLKGLEKRTTFEFNDTPLADVLSYCQEASGVNLVINWKALEDLGINRETPVSLTLKNRSALDALHKVAAIVSSDEGNPMVVQLVDNVLYVTSASELGAGIRAIAAYRLPSKVVRKEDGTAQFVGMTLSTVGTPHEWLNNGGRVAHVDVFAKRYAVLLAPSRHHEELRAILKQE